MNEGQAKGDRYYLEQLVTEIEQLKDPKDWSQTLSENVFTYGMKLVIRSRIQSKQLNEVMRLLSAIKSSADIEVLKKQLQLIKESKYFRYVEYILDLKENIVKLGQLFRKELTKQTEQESSSILMEILKVTSNYQEEKLKMVQQVKNGKQWIAKYSSMSLPKFIRQFSEDKDVHSKEILEHMKQLCERNMTLEKEVVQLQQKVKILSKPEQLNQPQTISKSIQLQSTILAGGDDEDFDFDQSASPKDNNEEVFQPIEEEEVVPPKHLSINPALFTHEILPATKVDTATSSISPLMTDQTSSAIQIETGQFSTQANSQTNQSQTQTISVQEPRPQHLNINPALFTHEILPAIKVETATNSIPPMTDQTSSTTQIETGQFSAQANSQTNQLQTQTVSIQEPRPQHLNINPALFTHEILPAIKVETATNSIPPPMTDQTSSTAQIETGQFSAQANSQTNQLQTQTISFEEPIPQKTLPVSQYIKTIQQKEDLAKELQDMKNQMLVFTSKFEQFEKITKQNESLSQKVAQMSQEKEALTLNYRLQPFFQGNVFQSNECERLRFISHIERKGGLKIKGTRLLYRYDPYNPTNFHRYIDNVQGLAFVVKTKAGFFVGAFYSGKLVENEILNQYGLLISISNDESYELYSQESSSKINRLMVYDNFYAIFGNAELRVKYGEDFIFSNFGIPNSYFNHMNRKVHEFLGEGNTREVKFETYEFYQVTFCVEEYC